MTTAGLVTDRCGGERGEGETREPAFPAFAPGLLEHPRYLPQWHRVGVCSQAGEQFTINFMTDYVNAANREVNAKLEGDTWIVTINNSEVYEVPVAAIEGG